MLQHILTPDLLEALSQLLVVVLMGIVLPRVTSWMKISLDDKQRSAVEAALKNGLNYAINQYVNRSDTMTLRQAIRDIVSDTKLKQEIVKQAAAYAKQSVPTALKKLGVHDNDLLVAKVEARFNDVLDYLIGQAFQTEKLTSRS